MTTRLMLRIAALLPERHRGVYAGRSPLAGDGPSADARRAANEG